MNKLRAVIAGLLLWSGAAMAQAPQAPQIALSWLPIGKIAGGYSVTTSTSPMALPAGGDTVWACNTGTNDAYVTLGNSASFGATTNSWLKAGTCWGYARKLTNGSIANYILAVTALSTTQFQVETGIGTPPFQLSTSGGGGGGGGAVYGPTAVGSAAANPPVLIGGTSDGTATGLVGVAKVLGGNVYVQCANCSGSGASAVDSAAFTAGSSVFAPDGGVFNDGLGALTSGQQAAARITSFRAAHVNLRNNSGAEIGTASIPVQVSLANTGTNTNPLAVSGTVAFSNTSIAVTQATAASLNATVVGTGTFAVQLTGTSNNINNIAGTITLPTGASTSALQSTGNTSLASIDGKTPALGQALAAASVPVVLPAAQITALTPPTTVTVTQATAANLNATVVGTGTFPVQAAQSGAWIVNPSTAASWGIGSSTQNSAVVANGHLVLGQYNSSPTAITSGNMSPFQLDANGNLKVNVTAGGAGGGAITAASGAYAAGSIAAGALASGAGADGWDSTQGTKSDGPCASGSTTPCTVSARLAHIENLLAGAVPLATTGGWTPKRLSALTTTVQAIKSSAAGQLGLALCSNSGTNTLFIQLFDVATAGGVTLGSTAPTISMEVPPGTPSGYALPVNGLQFANGIQAAATTTASGSTAPGTLPNCNFGYN